MGTLFTTWFGWAVTFIAGVVIGTQSGGTFNWHVALIVAVMAWVGFWIIRR